MSDEQKQDKGQCEGCSPQGECMGHENTEMGGDFNPKGNLNALFGELMGGVVGMAHELRTRCEANGVYPQDHFKACPKCGLPFIDGFTNPTMEWCPGIDCRKDAYDPETGEEREDIWPSDVIHMSCVRCGFVWDAIPNDHLDEWSEGRRADARNKLKLFADSLEHAAAGDEDDEGDYTDCPRCDEGDEKAAPEAEQPDESEKSAE